jgi:hypothetical protein
MKRFLRDNSLTLAFGAGFLVTLLGQAVSGWQFFNSQQRAQGGEALPFLRYLSSSEFAVDVVENWQSEYLQFFLFIIATVWLVQRGSTQSKKVDEVGIESDREQRLGRYATAHSPLWARIGGIRTAIYSRSLGLLMGTIFLLCWLAQSIAGRAAFNAEQLANRSEPVSWVGYLGTAEFWNRTLQNWQSELLAVASIAAFSIYLRQRGSPESKPVGAPHDATAVEG